MKEKGEFNAAAMNNVIAIADARTIALKKITEQSLEKEKEIVKERQLAAATIDQVTKV